VPAPLCLSVTSRPATAKVVERAAVDVLAVTWNVTVPLPVPLEPDTMLTQLALSVAVHPQVEAVATLTVTRPPAADIESSAGVTVKLHVFPD
jgi:hypothetical protein